MEGKPAAVMMFQELVVRFIVVRYDKRMAANKRSVESGSEYRWEYGKLIPRAVIRRYARQVAERFRPERIILFGSYAYGKPDKDSDVDILVVMPAYDETNQAVRIRRNTDHPFPLDLIVRTPDDFRWRLEAGESFMREIVSKGKVLYEKSDGALDSKSGERFAGGKKPRKGKAAVPR